MHRVPVQSDMCVKEAEDVNQEFCSRKPCFHLRGVYCVWLQSQRGPQSSINLSFVCVCVCVCVRVCGKWKLKHSGPHYWECRSPSMLITAVEVSSVCSQLWTSLERPEGDGKYVEGGDLCCSSRKKKNPSFSLLSSCFFASSTPVK